MLTKKEKNILIQIAIREVGGCEECSVRGILNPNELQTHRITRGYQGGKYVPSNIKIVCKTHHRDYHTKEEGIK